MIQRTWLLGLLSFLIVSLLEFAAQGAQAPSASQSVLSSTGLPALERAVDSAPTLSQEQISVDLQHAIRRIAEAASSYTPREVVALADPTNYGDRYVVDANGRPVYNDFIAVLHETVGSAQSALNTFRTPHTNEDDQVSYHTLIGREGTVYYVVPPEKRAFGAGDSVFDGPNGPETVLTNPAFPPSVNNFAYHVSLETPPDGRGNGRRHSGYTQAQYESLAWLLARTNIPDSRITTHQAVDRSGTRLDPRSFDREKFMALLHRYPSRAGLSS